ncbi:CcmD family protein [Aquirufa sp. ROCK-SH2]
MKSFLLMIGFILLSFIAQAQEVEMADKFRQDGKIYVVIAVVAVILTGIFVYLFRLDTKISKLEKQLKK